jgi:uncharacterized protein YbjT (DUF2867 family)
MTLPPILVTGGTGTLGQQVVSRLRETGQEVRVLSRRSRERQDGLVFVTGDLATGEGLAAAVLLAKLPVIPVPAGFVTQPVDSGEVAARLAELSLGQPRGRVPDMAGPHVLSFADLIRTYLTATGRRPRPVVPIWTPGIGPIRAGALYPQPGTAATLGHRSWPDFLAAKPTSEKPPDRTVSG